MRMRKWGVVVANESVGELQGGWRQEERRRERDGRRKEWRLRGQHGRQ